MDQIVGKESVFLHRHISELHWKPEAGLLGRMRLSSAPQVLTLSEISPGGQKSNF